MIISEPTEIKLKLMSDEIEDLIAELERVPYSIFKFMHYGKIVKKLKESLEDKKPKKKK